MKLPSIFLTSLLVCSCAVDKDHTPEPSPATQLPKAKVAAPYQYTLKAMPGSTPTGNMHLSTGSLPNGLRFTFSKEEQASTIAGTAKKLGTYSFSISEWCFGTQTSGDHFKRNFTLQVE